MKIFVKLPPNSGQLLVTDKFFKTRRCPLFWGFTVKSENETAWAYIQWEMRLIYRVFQGFAYLPGSVACLKIWGARVWAKKWYINVFLVGATMIGAVVKFWILAFLEALKTKFKDF